MDNSVIIVYGICYIRKLIKQKNYINIIWVQKRFCSYGFCNALKHELSQDDHVKIATFSMEHPLINKQRVIVETDGNEPKKALQSAANRLGKELDKLKGAASEFLGLDTAIPRELKGCNELIVTLRRQMFERARAYEFEQAAVIRDRITLIEKYMLTL